MHGLEYKRELYDLGVVFNLAHTKPRALDDLVRVRAKPVRNEELAPGPVRIPRKTSAA